MNDELTIGAGRRVVLHLALRLADGTEVESTFGGEPLAFTVGDGTLEEGLERLLFGLRAGERADYTLGPGDAFGSRDPERRLVIPRTDFPLEMSGQLQPGLVIGFTAPNGAEVGGTVTEVEIDRVTVDFNHPLAGRTVRMAVEVVGVE